MPLNAENSQHIGQIGSMHEIRRGEIKTATAYWIAKCSGGGINMKAMRNGPVRRLRLLALAGAVALALAGQGDAPEAVQSTHLTLAGSGASAEAASERLLIPGGKSVGIAIATEGLVVVGTSDIGQYASPAQQAGLKAGDVITRINDNAVNTAADLAVLLRAGEDATVTIMRNSREKQVKLTPVADPRDGQTRIGAWVRTSTAGVGTLTYIDPETGTFGALGHAISDVDTGVTLPVSEGGLYNSRIVQINRGAKGRPGEIVGDFLGDAQQIGEVSVNGDMGIYGSYYAADVSDLMYPQGLPVGRAHSGSAQLLTTISDNVEAFDCEIEHIESRGASPVRSIVVHVTDARLIEAAGGIVQGMSGSPIIQDGHIVGAVTHVFVNDPTRGYGTGVQDMLDTAEDELQAA